MRRKNTLFILLIISMFFISACRENEPVVQPESKASMYKDIVERDTLTSVAPVTTIQFYIPDAAFVTLIVYGPNRRAVAVILNEEYCQQGYHAVSFDAQGMASGAYVYHLIVKDEESRAIVYESAKKMLLIK